MALWNPWHGCRKISEGCRHCYVYRTDSRYGRDSSVPERNTDFDLPLRRDRTGEYKIRPGELVYTCFTSDFFLDTADQWREEAWDIMRRRPDLHYLIVTKRIDRFAYCVPADWSDGWDNVTICCTCENQDRADYRLPVFLQMPIKHRQIVCEPLLEAIDLSRWLGGWIENVVVGGESGNEARLCDYEWVLDIRRQCMRKNVPFHFKQTGALFRREGKVYRVPRRLQHIQARKAGINTDGEN